MKIAHTENEKGEVHLIVDHTQGVSKLMDAFATNVAFKNIYNTTGLLHDLGKYQPDFQKYLIEGGRRGSVPHGGVI